MVVRERDLLLTCSPNGKRLCWFVAVTFDESFFWTGRLVDKSSVDEGEEDNGHVTGLLAGQINENCNTVLLLLSNQLSSSVCGSAKKAPRQMMMLTVRFHSGCLF